MFNKNQEKKKFRHSEFQNSFLHDNQSDEKQHKKPRLDIQFNARRYGEPSSEQNRGTLLQSMNTNPGKPQKSHLESRSNRLLTTKSLSANAIDSNKVMTHTSSFSNRAGKIYSFNKDASSKNGSEYFIDFHSEKGNMPRSKSVSAGKTNYLQCTTAVVSPREDTGKSLGNSTQNDDIWGEDLDEVTVEECMLLATQASQTCIPEPPATTKTTDARALSNNNVTKSLVTVGGRSEFFQHSTKVKKIDNTETVGVSKELEINNYHHKETLNHETVKQGIVQIPEVQKVCTENNKLKESILTKEGEVSILRTQLNEAKSEIEAQKQERLKAMESLTKEFNDKLKSLEKELQQTKTQLEFKNIETESIEEQKLLKCKKKVKLVAPEPVVPNSTMSGSFNDRSTFTDSPKRAKKQLRKKGEELKKISQGSRFGYQVSSSLFEKVPKKVQSVTNVCSVNTTPDFSDDKLAYLTPQAVTINAAYTGINQLFLLDSFEDEKAQPLIKWVVWECFKVIICQLALLEAHGTVQSLKHRTLLNKKVLNSAGKFVGNSPSLISPKPWHDMEQGVETRRALGVLSAIASVSENAAGYMIGCVEPVESHDLKKWKLQSPIKNETSTSSIPRTFSLEGKAMSFQQILLYRPGSATEDELFRYHQIALSSSSVCQREVPQHCSKGMTELPTRNANNSKLLEQTGIGSTSNTTTYMKPPFPNQEASTVRILDTIGMVNNNTQTTSLMQEHSFSSSRLKTLLTKHSGFKFLPVKNKAFMKQLEMMKEPASKEHNKKDTVVEELKSNSSKNKNSETEPKQHTNEINIGSTNKGEDLLQVLYSLTRCICEQRLSLYFCGVLCAVVVLIKGIASKTHIGQERHALIGMLLKELVFCLPCANVLVEMTALLCWLGRYDLIMKSFCNWTGQSNETRRMYDIKTYPKTKCTLQLLSLLLRLRKAGIKQYVELADNLTRWLICIGNDATALEPSWISIPAAKPHETPPKICPCRTHIMDATIMLLYTCYEYLQKTGFDKNNNLYHVASKLPGRGMVLLYRLLGKVRDFEVFINKSEGEYELLLKGIEQNAKHLPLSEEEEEAFRWLLEVEADHWSQIPSVPLGDKDGAVSNSVCSFLTSQMS